MDLFLSIPHQLGFGTNFILLLIFLGMLVLVVIKFVISSSMLESITILSMFSVFISFVYLLLDAPDVAMTEVSIASCISTCVLLNMVKVVGNIKYIKSKKLIRKKVALVLCICLICILSFAGKDLPQFAAVDSNVQNYMTEYYIQNTKNEIGISSIVAAILASYRGYDTLGETIVILIAGLSVLIILSSNRIQKDV
ncbi:hydrogen gas-evolving membrane-bound hydrogenase subunit E [Rickettsia endosymbiont of Cardiosporidium cionae]|uniref:hydrogen gas-evolving membrane-bound hydrogenase subunit E n=1 Tax=Rickettsia endosymbiont of Cardiosporidium cionae TaxID=2777155 RepID=UPI0018933154|nr:hydrogen gas-evolving membrane-bound hydrogenase subunit E [Rickettsia endosymbiont of Cardiosporidium cionae]KAF8818247.1 hypothetical protein IHI24_000706 [Rickettsia endosymbiont of Cardiosporidium cionae]